MLKNAKNHQLSLLRQIFDELTMRRFPPQQYPPVDLDLKCDVFEHFDCEKVLSLLVGEAAKTYGVRSALLAALRVWTIRPLDERLIRSAVVQSVARSLAKAEKELRGADDNPGQIGDILARININREFYSKLYYPCGGMDGIIRARTRASITKELRTEVPHMATTGALMTIFHYLSSKLDKIDFNPPSVRLATKLLAEKSPAYGNNKNLGDRSIALLWSRHRASAPFWYAASALQMPGGQTLLDKLAGQSNISAETLRTWMGMVKFINNTILVNMHSDISNIAIQIPPSVIEVPFPCRELNDSEIYRLEQKFVKKRSPLLQKYK
jgi:hypothetical protein